jgi:anti-sigma B factor antagonist
VAADEPVLPADQAGDPGERRILTVQAQAHDSATVLRVAGEVDLLTAPELKAEIEQALGAEPRVLVVDLSEVGFLGSSGLAVLVQAQELAGERTDVRVVANSPATLDPLLVVGLGQHLAVFATRDEALSAE